MATTTPKIAEGPTWASLRISDTKGAMPPGPGRRWLWLISRRAGADFCSPSPAVKPFPGTARLKVEVAARSQTGEWACLGVLNAKRLHHPRAGRATNRREKSPARVTRCHV